jgi:anaerobic selenocysteine-containing dehydrogenase
LTSRPTSVDAAPAAIIDLRDRQSLPLTRDDGVVEWLAVNDPFFHRLGAIVSQRTFCASGSQTAYLLTVGPTVGVHPESLVHPRCVVIWACDVVSTNLHLWKFFTEAQRNGAPEASRA